VVSTQTGTQAIDRAAHLLVLLVESEDGFAVGELADRAGLPKSTTSRLVRALERHGLVQRDVDGGALRPGQVLVDYARRGAGDADLIDLARPVMERLAERCGETVSLGVATVNGVDSVAQVDSRFLLGTTNWVGLRVPYHASAVGKVFLAHGVVALPAGRLERLTARTLTSREALSRQLVDVRRRGYATIVDELEPGLMAVAAPVRSALGSVIAGISISGPSVRLTPADLDRLGAHLVDETAHLSARLGHQALKEGAA